MPKHLPPKSKGIALRLLIFFSLMVSCGVTSQREVNIHLKSLGESMIQLRDEDALQQYENVLATDPRNFEALCHASYLYGQIGKRLEGKDKQRAHYEKALRYARRALKENPEHAESNFAMAWAYGGMALISSPRRKATIAKEMKTYIDRALKYNPQHDRAWYVLANWYFRIANANTVERLVAKVLFGGLPKGVTNEKAIAAYQKAIKCRPNVIRYYDELARAYEKIKHSEKAIEQLELALSLTPQTADDSETLRRCLKRLGELKKKCRSESQKAFSMQSTPKPDNN